MCLLTGGDGKKTPQNDTARDIHRRLSKSIKEHVSVDN